MRGSKLVGVRKVVFSAAAAGCFACASAPTQNAMLRETRFGPRAEIVDPEGKFRTALSLPFSVDTSSADPVTLEIPMTGSEIPMSCYIWREGAELGVTALRIAQMVFGSLEEDGVGISNRQIASIKVGAIDGVAYQSISMTFHLEVEGEVGTGLMKAASANTQGHGIACQQWDAGYVTTLDQAFAELVGNFRAVDPGTAPYYKEITQVRIGDLTVGVVTTSFTRDNEGDIQGIAEGSTLIPTTAGDFHASYSKTTDWSRQNGDLINAYDFESHPDSEQVNLALNRDAEHGWQVTGLFQGKEIEATIGHQDRVDSMLSDYATAKYELAPTGSRSTVVLKQWIPDADPTKLIDVPITVDSQDIRYLTTKLGNLEFRWLRDADGIPESCTVNLGGHTMTFERIYQDGEI